MKEEQWKKDGDANDGSCQRIRSEPLWSFRTSSSSPLNHSPGKQQSEVSESSVQVKEEDKLQSNLIKEFQSECEVVLRGLAGSIEKAVTEGKSIIIEGIHLDIKPILNYIHRLCAENENNDESNNSDSKDSKYCLGNVIVVPLLLKVDYCTMDGDGQRDDMIEKWLETRWEEMASMTADVLEKDQVLVCCKDL